MRCNMECVKSTDKMEKNTVLGKNIIQRLMLHTGWTSKQGCIITSKKTNY